MGLAINPKDPHIFATACLDRTVKIWNLGSPHANFTLYLRPTMFTVSVTY
jgi:coatomer subunit beta'